MLFAYMLIELTWSLHINKIYLILELGNAFIFIIASRAVFRGQENFPISKVEYRGNKNGSPLSSLEFWGYAFRGKEGEITRISQSTIKVQQMNLKVINVTFLFLSCFSFLPLCATDCSTTRSESTINCLIILVTPAHNEIFIPCLQQSLAEAVLLFLN